MNSGNLLNTIILVAVFGLVFTTWCICIFLWVGQYFIRVQKIQKRLGLVFKESDETQILRLWGQTQKDIHRPLVPKSTLRDRLDAARETMGWATPVEIVVAGVFAIALLAFAVTRILGGSTMLGLASVLLILVVFWMYVQKRIEKRTILFERQFLDALGVAARSLRAGHPLVGSFRLIAEEIGEPVGNIFFKIYQEQSLGSDLVESIRKVARGATNPELKLFATSVAIQLHSGGNLADLMDSLASVIRARMKIRRRVRVLTAQTQLSKRILIAIPFILLLILTIISPNYLQPLYTTNPGKYMLTGMIMSIIVGSWVMHKMSILRF